MYPNYINWQTQHYQFFQQPFLLLLLLEYKSETLFIPCVLVKSWHCQYSSHSHNLPSRLTSLCTDSINYTSRNMWGLLLSQHLLLKCLAVPHLSFFVLMMLLCMVNLAIKSAAEPTYWSPQFLQEIMLITLGLLQDKLPLTLCTLPVALQLNLLSNIR